MFKTYSYTNHDRLKWKFQGSETIAQNHSEAFQDMFVLTVLDGKIGTYLEIGAGDPFYGNNTALLEDIGWNGISIDWDEGAVEKFNRNRRNKCIQRDATKVDYQKLLKQYAFGDTIDYLQIDCDPADTSYQVLLEIPFDKLTFKVITFEHDVYQEKNDDVRQKSRKILEHYGYIKVVGNISPDFNRPYEDWYVHKSVMAPKMRNLIDYSDKTIMAEKYMMKSISDRDAFKLNSNQNKRVFIVDNFYADPDLTREFALDQEFTEGAGYIGQRTTKQFLFNNVKERFEQIIGERITKWEDHGQNGRFQYNVSGNPLVYHCDDQRWAAMIYLTPDAPVQTGTSSFRHRETGIYHNSDPNIVSCFNQKTFLDKTPYEEIDRFGNVYNRLVIFDGGLIHSASEYFGSDKNDSRLWHMFFFDT